ncbi:MAG TPA: carbohydrate ABC transporter permease, partial [Lentisphaeria bacterium]|nr:carbohydrate ABC transporter permease [Lentisphaeria bacterium]
EGMNIKGGLVALAGPYIGFALPISILILRGAFAALPPDLLDASRVDGCSAWGVFRHVALPLSRPALATVVIFNFLTMWNEFAFALTLLGPGCETLPLALTRFKGEHDIQITQTSAALVLVVIPLIIVYVFAQKHIIRGLTAGAVKE